MLPSGTSQLRRLPTFLLALAATLAAAFSLGAITAQADVGGEVSVTTEGAGRTDYWTAGSDGHVYERTLTDRWSDWADLGAPDGVGLASAPFVLHIPDNSPATQRGKYFIFALGGDHAMWLKTYTPGSGWSGWVDQQYGQFSTGFTASYSSGGDWINVVGADMSGNLVWRVYNQGSRTGLGGTTTNTLGRLAYPPAFLDWHTAAGAQRADVFGVNTSGQVWTATNSNLVWSPASVMLQPPGLTGQLATATNDAGKALIAARDQDRVTAVVNWSTDGTFGAWQSLGGMMGTAPSVHYSLTAAGQAHWQLVARDGGVPLGTDPGTGTPTGCHADVYLRPAQIVVRDRYGTDGWGEWHGISPTPGAPFYGTSHHFGGDDSQPGDHGLCGVIDTPDEIANVVAAIRGGSPQDAQTAIDGINPENGERDRVLAAVREADTNATVSVTHSDADHLDLWVERAGSVYVRSWVSGTGWHDWVDLEAPVAAGVSAAPDAIRTPDGRLQVFVTGRDDKLYMKMLYPPGFSGHAEGWTDWTKIADGPFAPGVQAAWSNGGDWIDVVTRTKADNKLDWLHWTAGGNAWIENVRNDDGNTRLSVTPSVVDWTRDGSNLPEADVFAKDANGDAMWTINTNLAWSPWQSLTQGARSPIDAAVGDNRIIVAQLGSNGASAIGESYTPAGSWEGWDYTLGGNLSSAPTVNYWPDAAGNGRWELFGRDGGALAGGRPGQIVYNERPDGSSWTGWVGITHLPGLAFYGTSTQFGNGDGINTQSEIDAAASAIRGASAIVADSMLDGITPGTERDDVWRAAFPTSWACGDSTTHSATTDTQIACVLGSFDGASSDAGAQTVLDGLTKDNVKRLDAALAARVSNGELVRDISDGAVYQYAGGIIRPVASSAIAEANGRTLASAKRVTHAVISRWTLGPALTMPVVDDGDIWAEGWSSSQFAQDGDDTPDGDTRALLTGSNDVETRVKSLVDGSSTTTELTTTTDGDPVADTRAGRVSLGGDPCSFSNARARGLTLDEPTQLDDSKPGKYTLATTFMHAKMNRVYQAKAPNGQMVNHKYFFGCATGGARAVDVDHIGLSLYVQKMIFGRPNRAIRTATWSSSTSGGGNIALNVGVAAGPFSVSMPVPLITSGRQKGTEGEYYTPAWLVPYASNQVSGIWEAGTFVSKDWQGQSSLAIWDVQQSEANWAIVDDEMAHWKH
ncbi:hypothetical protein [Conexibacter woesei]|uniref:hypothetical protein n=1 Tax=Conexibacter woesei TaxID=191495 RepID=UPI00041C6C77|nr:hypothetical protein [Conexibacter woesei]